MDFMCMREAPSGKNLRHEIKRESRASKEGRSRPSFEEKAVLVKSVRVYGMREMGRGEESTLAKEIWRERRNRAEDDLRSTAFAIINPHLQRSALSVTIKRRYFESFSVAAASCIVHAPPSAHLPSFPSASSDSPASVPQADIAAHCRDRDSPIQAHSLATSIIRHPWRKR